MGFEVSTAIREACTQSPERPSRSRLQSSPDRQRKGPHLSALQRATKANARSQGAGAVLRGMKWRDIERDRPRPRAGTDRKA